MMKVVIYYRVKWKSRIQKPIPYKMEKWRILMMNLTISTVLYCLTGCIIPSFRHLLSGVHSFSNLLANEMIFQFLNCGMFISVGVMGRCSIGTGIFFSFFFSFSIASYLKGQILDLHYVEVVNYIYGQIYLDWAGRQPQCATHRQGIPLNNSNISQSLSSPTSHPYPFPPSSLPPLTGLIFTSSRSPFLSQNQYPPFSLPHLPHIWCICFCTLCSGIIQFRRLVA